MCAKVREKKPVKKNGRATNPKGPRFGVDVEVLRSSIGPQVVGLQAGRAWTLG